MKVLDYIKANFLQMILLVLVCVVLLQRGCERVEEAKPTVTVTRDSVWVFHDSVIYSKPKLVMSEKVQVLRDTQWLPAPDQPVQYTEYRKLFDKWSMSNYYNDSVRIDSIGWLYLRDTVSHNLLTGRSYKYDLKYPFVHENTTVQLPYKPTRQLYIGGGLEATKGDLINKLKAGILYKDRKDRIYLIGVGADRGMNISAEVQTFWKIKL